MPDAGLAARLRAAFRWTDANGADTSGWWRDPLLLRDLGPGLGALFADDQPTVVVGIASRGTLLGGLTAVSLGVGFADIRKDRKAADEHGGGLLRRTTPPDYADRDLELTLRAGLLGRRDRVLLVDDWIATGAQAVAAARLVADAEAQWLGAAVIVDATTAAVRRTLTVRSLLAVGQL